MERKNPNRLRPKRIVVLKKEQQKLFLVGYLSKEEQEDLEKKPVRVSRKKTDILKIGTLLLDATGKIPADLSQYSVEKVLTVKEFRKLTGL